jgi:hypothetical protein
MYTIINWRYIFGISGENISTANRANGNWVWLKMREEDFLTREKK